MAHGGTAVSPEDIILTINSLLHLISSYSARAQHNPEFKSAMEEAGILLDSIDLDRPQQTTEE